MSMVLDPITAVEEPLIIEEKKPKWKLNWRRDHLALGAILMLAAFLGLWNLSINNYSNEYYAAAVKSMLQSWHNFFYVSFDPGGFVTVDKPPVAFWIQTAFAKVFGFSGVSILLPEALAGIGGVFLLYHLVKRAFGTGAGLVSALLLAVTPIWVVMNRDNNPDSILVFTLILAAWAMLRAAEKGRLRWLMVAGLLVGVAFNVKMLEAYVVLPAFFLMYFLMARTSWFKRIWHLALMTAVIVVISFSWAVAVDLTPASDRPYVDSSSANSELDLILNYNGLDRVQGQEMGGTGGGDTAPTNPTGDGTATTSTTSSTATSSTDGTNGTLTPPQDGTTTDATRGGPTGGGGGGASFGGEAGITRLLTPQDAGEFNWFMPLALLGLTYLGFQTRFGMKKSEERTRQFQSLMLWGGWFMIYGLIFSLSKGTFHSYYLTIMAPAEAALAGSALVVMWQRYRHGGWQAWLLPVGLAATAFYQAYILTGYTSWNPWVGPVLIVVGICALVGLALGNFFRSQRFSKVLTRGIVWVTMGALLATPFAWSIRAVFTAITGSIVSGTPSGGMGGGFGNNNSSTSGISTWLNFVSTNLSGQLILIVAVVALGAVLFGLRYLLRRQRCLFNQPALTGVLLAFLLVSSSGWWINVAQAQTTSQTTARTSNFPGGDGGMQMGSGQNTDEKLIQYLLANQDGYEYLVAVSSSNSASSIILETGQPVMALGGFTGSDKTITSTSELEQLIANHTIRYFLIGGGMGGGGQSSSTVTQYVQNTCQAVDTSLYSSSTTTATAASTATSSSSQTATTSTTTDTTRSSNNFGGQQSQQLYVCGS